MPVFLLNDSLEFPQVYLSEPDGLLAVGGDLSPNRLLLAYQMGIFPWFSQEDPILWWSPDPRMVMFPGELKVSKSMRPLFNQQKFRVSFDQNFAAVIKACKQKYRPGQSGTWITEEMVDAYLELHRLGFAHSVEVWQGETLVGGLYGVSLGRFFFGESMFSNQPNASKTGFITLVNSLVALEFELIDCQVYTKHLDSLGARLIPRKQFIEILRKGISAPTLQGNWSEKLPLVWPGNLY
ncbi:MAG: leucyl/phenylalanyl-tRNA--protein transferase [Bacteroidia bacterium]|nr:leucyl/phenylalanyl-tRNA--protein transferase [Bacteroidia bacterium]